MIIKSFIAIGAGLISFLSPCVLPIIPGYISYITGKKLDEIEKNRRVVLIKTIVFSFGFSTVFILLGIAASRIGKTDERTSKTLCLHIPFLLPPNYDVEIPLNV